MMNMCGPPRVLLTSFVHSYTHASTKIVRNKMIRMKEVRREKAAKAFMKNELGKDADDLDLVSSWGPYVTTSGTAKNTGVKGLTLK